MQNLKPTPPDSELYTRPKSIAAMAARLKLTRIGLGLSQAELCRRADLSRNTYNQWERGHGRPDVHYAIRLCETFGITLDWIFRGEIEGLSPELAEMVLCAVRPQARLRGAAERTATTLADSPA